MQASSATNEHAARSDAQARPQRHAYRSSMLLALAVLAIGVAFTTFAWLTALKNEHRAAERALVSLSAQIETAIRTRLLAYEAVLRAGVGLLGASQNVTAEEWRRFAEQLRFASLYPGMQGFGFAARVSRSNEPGGRDRTSILYLEPQNERNARALGFDMMSEITRRRAMERARDAGSSTLSGNVTLVQEITDDKQAGFLLYVPVYRNTATPETLAGRRDALRGFVYGPFRAEDLLNTVLGRLTEEVHLEIYDVPAEAGAPTLMYSSIPRPANAEAPGHTRLLELMGHRWLIRATALQPLYDAHTTSDPRWIAFTGGISSILLAGLVWALAMNRRQLADRLHTESLARQRERYSTEVLEHSLDAYIAVNEQDRIVEWNRQAEVVFGWTREQAIGQRLADTIVPSRFRDAHVAAIDSFSTRTHTLLGRRVTMPAMRFDGQEITVELSILPTTRGEQPLFVASLRDITELRRQEAEIVALNTTLEQRVAQRTEELADANRELHSVNEQLEAFTHNVSHDLRAPLRAVGAFTQIAIEESGEHLGESARRHLSSAVRQVQKMQRLVDDLLKLAFVGRQAVQKRSVNLCLLVRGVIEDMQFENPPPIEIDPEQLGNVFADAALLEHALRNLLSNAAKFSEGVSAPCIRIGSALQDGERVYFVQDNGVGFDSQYAGQLFRVFHRLHGAQEFEGTGVGLSIVKSVIEKHGGRVWAESTPGEGATFYFTLPSEEQQTAYRQLKADG